MTLWSCQSPRPTLCITRHDPTTVLQTAAHINHAIFLQSAVYIGRCSIYMIHAYTVICMITYRKSLLHSWSLHCYGHPTRADCCTTQATSCILYSIVWHYHYMRQRHVDALSSLLLLHPKHHAGILIQTCKDTKVQETRNQNLQPTWSWCLGADTTCVGYLWLPLRDSWWTHST